MEALHFADAVPVVLLLVAIAIALGAFGSRFFSLPIATGLAIRAGIVGLRASGLRAVGREVDAKYFTEGSLDRFLGGKGYYYTTGSSRYEQYLTVLRRTGGLSVFGLEVLGLLVWALAGFVLISALRIFIGERQQPWLMWAFALSPAGLLFTNGILRESYEVLSVSAALWAYCRLRIAIPSSRSRVPVLAAAALLSVGLVFHTALGLSGVMLVMGTELLRGLRRDTRRPGQAALYVVAAIVVLLFSSSLTRVTGDLEAERTFRIENPNPSNTDYAPNLPNLGPLNLAAEITMGYVLYIVTPLPYQVRGPIDLVALAEAGLRILIMVSLVRRRRTVDVVAIALMAVSVQFAFSLGTHNWGTSLRHNYVSLPALLMIAALPLLPRRDLAAKKATSVEESPTAIPASSSDR
jgi:hypothetical protein